MTTNTDALAIASGISTGAILSESTEQIIASIGATIAVYLARVLIAALERRFKDRE